MSLHRFCIEIEVYWENGMPDEVWIEGDVKYPVPWKALPLHIRDAIWRERPKPSNSGGNSLD